MDSPVKSESASLRLTCDVASVLVSGTTDVLDIPASCAQRSTLVADLRDQLDQHEVVVPLPLGWDEVQAWVTCAEGQGNAGAGNRAVASSAKGEDAAGLDATLTRALKVRYNFKCWYGDWFVLLVSWAGLVHGSEHAMLRQGCFVSPDGDEYYHSTSISGRVTSTHGSAGVHAGSAQISLTLGHSEPTHPTRGLSSAAHQTAHPRQRLLNHSKSPFQYLTSKSLKICTMTPCLKANNKAAAAHIQLALFPSLRARGTGAEA